MVITNFARACVSLPLYLAHKHTRTSPEIRHGRVLLAAKGHNLNSDLWLQPAFPLFLHCPVEFTPVDSIRGKGPQCAKEGGRRRVRNKITVTNVCTGSRVENETMIQGGGRNVRVMKTVWAFVLTAPFCSRGKDGSKGVSCGQNTPWIIVQTKVCGH